MASRVLVWRHSTYITPMDGDQIANLAFLGLLGAAIAGSYIVSNRGQMGKMAQQAMIWGLIFVGVIAAFGMWGDIQSTVSPRQSYVGADEVVVPLDSDGHYHMTLEINDVPIEFIVDTGASQVVLSQQDAERAGIDLDALRYIGSAQTANGTVETAPVTLSTVELGGILDANVRAVVNGGDMNGSLLGMSYLNGFRSIEIRNGELVLKR